MIQRSLVWLVGSSGPIEDYVIGALLVLFCLFAPHSIAITQAAFYAAVCVWAVKCLRRGLTRPARTPFDWPLLGFVLCTLASAFGSYEPGISGRKLASVSLCLIFVLVAQQVRTIRMAQTLVMVMLASSLLNIGYVVYQKIRGRGMEIVRVEPGSPLAEAGVVAGDVILEVNGRAVRSVADVGAISAHSDMGPLTLFLYRPEIYIDRTVNGRDWSQVGSWGIEGKPWRGFRAAGFYGWNYFTYAEVLQLLGALVFGLWVVIRGRGRAVSVGLFMIVMAVSGAILLTVTRAIWIAYLSALIIMALRAWSRRAVIIILLGGVLAAPIAVHLFRQTRGQQLLSASEPSTAYRLTIWREGLDLLLDRPRHWLVGVGMDSLKVRWREWGLFQGGRLPVGHMHSTPVQVALERGIPALLCFVWWFGAYGRLLWRLTGSEGASLDGVSRGFCLGIFGGTAGFLASSLVHYNFGDSEVIMIVYFLMGVAVVLEREAHGMTRGEGNREKG